MMKPMNQKIQIDLNQLKRDFFFFDWHLLIQYKNKVFEFLFIYLFNMWVKFLSKLNESS